MTHVNLERHVSQELPFLAHILGFLYKRDRRREMIDPYYDEHSKKENKAFREYVKAMDHLARWLYILYDSKLEDQEGEGIALEEAPDHYLSESNRIPLEEKLQFIRESDDPEREVSRPYYTVDPRLQELLRHYALVKFKRDEAEGEIPAWLCNALDNVAKKRWQLEDAAHFRRFPIQGYPQVSDVRCPRAS